MSLAPVDIYVNDTTPLAGPVAGVAVKVTSRDGTTFFSQGITDSSGHAGFLLPDSTTYQIRLYKFQVSFVNPQLIAVQPSPATNSFTFSAQLLTPPISKDSRICVAYGFFRDITGAPLANELVHFIPKFMPAWVDGSAVLGGTIIKRTDEKGYMQIDLFRHAHYDCLVEGEEDLTRYIKVPDAPNVNLPDLLFPVVSMIEWNPMQGSYTLQAGKQLTVGFQVYASDGECLGPAAGQIRWHNSDQGVVGIAPGRDTVTFSGGTPGTATVRVTRADHSIVHIPDCGVVNGEITIVVTP